MQQAQGARKGRMEMLGSKRPQSVFATPRQMGANVSNGGVAPVESIDWSEQRVDPSDGNAYTRSSFAEVYGQWGYMTVWDAAERLKPPEPEPTPEEKMACNEAYRTDRVEAILREGDEAGRRKVVAELLSLLTSTRRVDSSLPDPVCAAYGLAGAVEEMGPPALTKFGMSDALQGVLEDKSSQCQVAVLTAIRLFLDALGEPALAFCQPMLRQIFAASDAPSAVRNAAGQLLQTVGAATPPSNVEWVAQACVSSMGSEVSRKQKAAALGLMLGLVKRADLSAAVCKTVPLVIPILVECCHETDPNISQTAKDCMDAVTLTIDHTETQKMRTLLLQAILFADKHTHECLDALSEMTFVNALEAPSLALMVPVLARGLRERGSSGIDNPTCAHSFCRSISVVHVCLKMSDCCDRAVVKQASMTASNIFSLVRNHRDIKPFLPMCACHALLVTHPHCLRSVSI